MCDDGMGQGGALPAFGFDDTEGDDPVVTARLVSALVVEDNLVIAMDVRDALLELGAKKVLLAGRVAEALEIVTRESLSFVLLDASLGNETSEEVAWACVRRGIQVILSSGYGADSGKMNGYPRLPLLEKPYGLDELRRAIES